MDTALEVLSEHTLVDLKLYSLTVYKVVGDALQPYEELTWEHGYMWK